MNIYQCNAAFFNSIGGTLKCAREIFRIEIHESESSYQRTTLIDRDALEDLLESEDVRERILGDQPAAY